MKIENILEGMFVKDKWFSFHDGVYSKPWGKGVVVHITNTQVVVYFESKSEKTVIYDTPHLQFLESYNE